MAISYRTDTGSLAFVFSSSSTQTPLYYAVTMQGRGKGVRRIMELKKRLNEQDARKDLETYAQKRGWKPVY